MGNGAISNKRLALCPEWLSGVEQSPSVLALSRVRAAWMLSSYWQIQFPNHKSHLWICTGVLSLTSDQCCSTSLPTACHSSLVRSETGTDPPQRGGPWSPFLSCLCPVSVLKTRGGHGSSRFSSSEAQITLIVALWWLRWTPLPNNSNPMLENLHIFSTAWNIWANGKYFI